MANNDNGNDGPSKDESSTPLGWRRRRRSRSDELLAMLAQTRRHYEAAALHQQHPQAAEQDRGSTIAEQRVMASSSSSNHNQRRLTMYQQQNDARRLRERIERLQRSYLLRRGGEHDVFSGARIATPSIHHESEQQNTRGLSQQSSPGTSLSTGTGGWDDELLEILQQALDISSSSFEES